MSIAKEEQAAREAEPKKPVPDIDFGDSDEEEGAPVTAEKASAPGTTEDSAYDGGGLGHLCVQRKCRLRGSSTEIIERNIMQ